MLNGSYFRNFFYFAFVISILCGCNNANTEFSDIENQIDSEVNKTEGAENPEIYSKYFYKKEGNIIYSVYIIHSSGFAERVKGACSKSKNTEYPCTESDFGVASPGEMKWLDDPIHFPAQNGGSCSYIWVEYDSKKKIVSKLRCNGPI